MYTLSNQSEKFGSSGVVQPAGLYVYDVQRMAEHEKVEALVISEAVVGVNKFLDFDYDTQTLCFLKDYSNILLIPLPHRNTLNFFGMGPKNQQYIWRQENGTFSSLNERRHLNMWSTVTGKILKNSLIEEKDHDGRK